jgi:hypothetical protein
MKVILKSEIKLKYFKSAMTLKEKTPMLKDGEKALSLT